MKTPIKSFFLVLGILLAAIYANAQDAMKGLNIDDYQKWSRITSVNLSDDGKCMSYGYSPSGAMILFISRTLNQAGYSLTRIVTTLNSLKMQNG